MQEKQQALGELDGKVQRTLTTAREYKLSEYTSRVIGDFVPNFVAMAMGIGRGRIFLASINSPIPKTPC